MTKLSIDDVEHIARLSRLELTQAEKEKFAKQLSNVIGYVEELNEVKTNDVEVMSQVTGLNNVTEIDLLEAGNISYNHIEKNAPEFRDGSFVVPGIFQD
ncbi:MAG: Glutamyl-tRNA(Gln) amidotransferase subunit C [bacterium ADurb.Bin212]|nr:MAG: Glutamyl-tRNA(Gln) amidotransferase subunit C [bacterium ADurb.Bin212]